MIPIIINNFNRFNTTKKLVKDLLCLGYTDLHILDNGSTYPPLLEWYETNPCIIERLSNMGNLAIYNSDYINKFKGWVAYTDSDIQLGKNTPKEFIERMIEVAEKYNYNKVGLALRVDNLPDTEYALLAKLWESKYWTKMVEKDIYEADVDTTFCIIKVGQPFQYQALRIAGDLTAEHIPWYKDYNNLDDEEKYMVEHSDPTYSTTKRYVNSLSLLE